LDVNQVGNGDVARRGQRAPAWAELDDVAGRIVAGARETRRFHERAPAARHFTEAGAGAVQQQFETRQAHSQLRRRILVGITVGVRQHHGDLLFQAQVTN
jgi:hypothetical protein